MPDTALVDYLTDLYPKYRAFVRNGGDRLEFENCRDALVGILLELNLRSGRYDELTHADERTADDHSNPRKQL
jgi:hypothetical protein